MEYDFKKRITQLYSEETLNDNLKRYDNLFLNHIEKFSNENFFLFSSPGRTEIAGNHTDHNDGKVIAAAVNIDMISAVNKTGKNIVTIFSEGFDSPFIVDINDLEKKENETGKPEALIRGIAFEFRKRNYSLGGFNANITSNVLIGSGLSSSASFEILITHIFNYLFNKNSISKIEISKISQAAENKYFEKPCGLMDQLAISLGGMSAIDFKEKENPYIENIDYDFENSGYLLALIDTGGKHTDLTEEYSSITTEMKLIAEFFGFNSCRSIDSNMLYERIPELRIKFGDRAVLRAIHFLNENERVEKQKQCLLKNDINKFLDLVNESGNSSYKCLQNIYPSYEKRNQDAALGLYLCEKYIKEKGSGACRIHGGGFGGTIQVYIPNSQKKEFSEYIDSFFGKGSVKFVDIRKYGAVCLDEL